MPLPPDDQLDAKITFLYDTVEGTGAGDIGNIAKRAAHLQVMSARRLVVALENATKAQDDANRRMMQLTFVGWVLSLVGLAWTFAQVVIAIVK